MTKYVSDKYGYRPIIETPITAGEEEYYAESRPPYICDFCHHTLIKLQDRSGVNQSWYCNSCNTEYDPETELRSKQSLTMSEGPVTSPSVSYAPEKKLTRKKREIKGGLKVISERSGVKVTSYSETNTRRAKAND
jgi:ribosomal protein L37AE/L43A